MADFKVRISADAKDFRNGIMKMSRAADGFAKKISAVKTIMKGTFLGGLMVKAATVFVTAIGRMIKGVFDFGSQLTDLQYQLGVDLKIIQAFQSAAENAGVKIDEVTNSLMRLKRAQGDALSGTKESVDAFAALGISLDDLARLGTEQLLERVAIGFAKSGRSAEAFDALLSVMGRSAGRLQEVLAQIASGIDNFSDSLYTMGQKNAQALDIVVDDFAALWRVMKRGAADAFGFVSRQIHLIGAWGYDRAGVRAAQAATQQAMERLAQAKAAAKRMAEIEDQERREKAKKEEEERKQREEEEIKHANKLRDIRESATRDPRTNQIRRIGGFTGGVESVQLQEFRRQIHIMNEQARYLRDIRRNTEGGGGLA